MKRSIATHSLIAALLAILINASQIEASKPIISEITKDLVANIDDNVEFNCTVENLGALSVSWAKQIGNAGSSVVLSMRSMLSMPNSRYSIVETKNDGGDSATYTFRISKVEASDMGSYECQVIVSVADKITKKLLLSVKHPPIISEERTPKNVLVTEGQNLEITCHADGFPQPTISWARGPGGFTTIMPDGGHTKAGPTLHVKQVHRLDRGGYYCIADNGVGQPDKRLIQVEVEFRPQIAVQRPKVAQAISHAAELECNVQGYPAPAVFWHRNGAKIQSSSQYRVSNTASSHETTSSVLRIDSVSSFDYGDYYCNATNKLGNADARLHLFQPIIPVPVVH